MRSPSCAAPFINHPKTCNLFSTLRYTHCGAGVNGIRKGAICFQSRKFCDGEKLSWVAGLWTCEQPIVVPCCTGVTLLYFSRVYFCISFLLYTSLRWPMVHDGRSGGVRSSGSPLTTRQPFLLCDLRGGWDGGVGVGGSTLVLVAMHMYMEGGRCTPAHSEQTRIRAAWLWKGLIRY